MPLKISEARIFSRELWNTAVQFDIENMLTIH